MATGRNGIWWIVLSFIVSACAGAGNSQSEALPFLGEMTWTTNADRSIDSSVLALPNWEFINQNGDTMASVDMAGKIRVADFFFTTCPTICPRMSGQMLRIQERFRAEPRLKLFSFSIDAKHDTPEVLKAYAERLGADEEHWYFLTGNPERIFELAAAHGSFAEEDANAPGGFAHSGAIILSDTQNRVRGLYDGTNPSEVDRLMDDIDKLLQEASDFGPKAIQIEQVLGYE